MKKRKLNIQLFAEGAGSAGAGTGAAEAAGDNGQAESTQGIANQKKGRNTNSLANVVYGKQENASDDYSVESGLPLDKKATEKTAEMRATEFENLIKGDYKEEFNNRVSKIVQGRLGDTKQMQQQNEAMKPIIDMLSKKYGVDAAKIEDLRKAIEDDDSFYQEEATRRGISVEQVKELHKMETENQQLRNALETRERQEQGDKIYQNWLEEGQQMAQKYGLSDFDFATEVRNPEFTDLLSRGLSVEAAYKTIHFDDMLGGAMAVTAQTVKKNLANNVAARSARPSEGALSSQPGVIVKQDVSKFTKADRAEIARRAARGEIIKL